MNPRQAIGLAILAGALAAAPAHAADGACEEIGLLERRLGEAPEPALLLRVADCRRSASDFSAAAAWYTKFLTLYPDDALAPLVRDRLERVEREERRQRKAARAAHGKISPEPASPATEVTPLAAPAAPQSAAVKSPAAVEERPAVVAAATVPAPAVKSGPQPASPPPAGRSRTWTWVAGAAVIALGAGAAFGIKARTTSSSLTSGVDANGRENIDSLYRSQHDAAQRANILFALGGGLAALSAVLLVLHY